MLVKLKLSMIINIFGTLSSFFLCFSFSWYYLLLKKTMKCYEKQLKATKYNIKVRPYQLFYNKFDNPIIEGIKNGNPYEKQ